MSPGMLTMTGSLKKLAFSCMPLSVVTVSPMVGVVTLLEDTSQLNGFTGDSHNYIKDKVNSHVT